MDEPVKEYFPKHYSHLADLGSSHKSCEDIILGLDCEQIPGNLDLKVAKIHFTKGLHGLLDYLSPASRAFNAEQMKISPLRAFVRGICYLGAAAFNEKY